MMGFDVALGDDVAVVHGRRCEHGVRSGRQRGFALDVFLEPDVARLVEDAAAVYRDWVTAELHRRVAGTPDAGCDVEFMACSGLVSTDPPALAI